MILIVFARPLGAFFHLGDAYTVFWAMVPLPILRSIQSPRLVSLYRRLDFHFVTILNVSEVAASFIFGLIAVLYWRDWRGLVFSMLAGAAVQRHPDLLAISALAAAGFQHGARENHALVRIVVQLRHAVRVHCEATRQSDRRPSARTRARWVTTKWRFARARCRWRNLRCPLRW